MMKKLISFVFSFLFAFPVIAAADNPDNIGRFTLCGYIRDQSNGEALAGVTVYCNELKTGTISNAYGFYSLNVPQGIFTVRFSFIGHTTLVQQVEIEKDLTLNIEMVPVASQLEEVVISGRRISQNVRAPEMSIAKLDAKSINKVPALLGEIDLIKVLQLMPGVQSTSEGSSGFSVRGGGSDQNLILLDEANIYNASHLLGFFSVFNNDAIKDVTLYKGDIPAAYGGRLSSLLDIRMKDGNTKKFVVTGSTGTISSKLTVEGPVAKDRSSFLISGRRTYADLFLPLSKNKDLRDNRLFFYDLNFKLAHVVSETDRLYLSAYVGKDTFKNKFASMGFGNQSGSFRWNHLFSEKMFSNLSLIYTRYNYGLGTPEGDANAFSWTSVMRDYSARLDFSWYLSEKHVLKYGATSTYHKFFPGSAKGLGSESAFTSFTLPSQIALEHSLYVSDEYKVNSKLSIKYGQRTAIFQNIGPGTYYRFDHDHNPTDSVVYKSGDFFNTYVRLEPRLAFTYLIDSTSSVKGSYSHTSQFITLAQNSTAGTPLDIWFPATPNVKPQLSDQLAAGYFRNLDKPGLEISAEIYYKHLRHVIEFRDHALLLLNPKLEGELRIGRGYSYGLEIMLRKNIGKLSGWVNYTYSRSFRLVKDINNGNRYPAPFDKPHSVNVVANYELSKRVSASATWVYYTGLPVTFPTGRAVVGNAVIPIFSDRNAYRMPDYHRLDLSVTLKGKQKPGKRWSGEWNLSVYNAYNRHNAWSINFTHDAADPTVTYAEKTYLFAVIPAITYNYRFESNAK